MNTDMNQSERIVTIFPPTSLTLEKDYYADNATVTEYFATMTKVFAAIHPNEEARRKAVDVARQVIDFETIMSSVLPEIDDLYNVNVSTDASPFPQAIQAAY
jgi:hypothetical protein